MVGFLERLTLYTIHTHENSFEHHTSFSAMDPDEALANMNKRLEQGQEALRKAKHVFLTLGSAHAYVLKGEEARVVANCHRLPASSFERKLLSKYL